MCQNAFMVRIEELLKMLDEGGVLRYGVLNGAPKITPATGQPIERKVDGRSYDTFCRRHQHKYSRMQAGIYIEWRKKQ